MDFTVYARVLEQALLAWNHKERYAFIKRVVKLRLEYDVEFEKPSWSDREDYVDAPVGSFRDSRIIRNYERELHIISQDYIARLPSEQSVWNLSYLGFFRLPLVQKEKYVWEL